MSSARDRSQMGLDRMDHAVEREVRPGHLPPALRQATKNSLEAPILRFTR